MNREGSIKLLCRRWVDLCLHSALAFAATIVILFLTPGAGGEEGNPFVGRLADAAHLPAFFILSVWMYRLLEPKFRFPPPYRATLLLSWLLAFSIEWIQPFVGRSASRADLALGFVGAIGGVTYLRVTSEHQSKLPPVWFFAFAALAVFIALRPPWFEWQAQNLRRQEFPVLGRFESRFELGSWRPEAGDNKSFAEVSIVSWNASEGQHSLSVTTAEGSWSGVRFTARNQNWSKYQALKFSIFNPGREFRLGLRVDDTSKATTYDDRFNEMIVVPTGWKAVSIAMDQIASGPVLRKLDLEHVQQFLLFTGENESGRTFFLDDVRLE